MNKEKNKKFNYQLMWAFILIGYGLFSFVKGMGFEEVSNLAMGVGMGQGSIFVIWGLREWFGGSNKK
jgi:hypothetical protein